MHTPPNFRVYAQQMFQQKPSKFARTKTQSCFFSFSFCVTLCFSPFNYVKIDKKKILKAILGFHK